MPSIGKKNLTQGLSTGGTPPPPGVLRKTQGVYPGGRAGEDLPRHLPILCFLTTGARGVCWAPLALRSTLQPLTVLYLSSLQEAGLQGWQQCLSVGRTCTTWPAGAGGGGRTCTQCIPLPPSNAATTAHHTAIPWLVARAALWAADMPHTSRPSHQQPSEPHVWLAMRKQHRARQWQHGMVAAWDAG